MTNDKLPARALAKIFALKDQEQQALTVMRSNQMTISELSRAVDINPHGPKAAAWRDEIARLQDLQQSHQSRYRTLADLNAKIEHYLVMLPANVEIEDAKKVKVKLKGQTHQQAVADVRLNIVKLIGERSEVERAALPIDEIKAQAKKWITTRGLQARPSITATHDKFAVQYSYMDPSAYAAVLDPLSLLAWFDPEHLETKLNEMIDAMPKPKLALTPAAKAERLASINGALSDAERLECALIEDAMDSGTIIEHRPGVGIAALLGIAVLDLQAKAA